MAGCGIKCIFFLTGCGMTPFSMAGCGMKPIGTGGMRDGRFPDPPAGKNIDILNEIPMENEVINIEESVKDKLLASLYGTLDFFKKELEEKKQN
jgi:hypothetical protein